MTTANMDNLHVSKIFSFNEQKRLNFIEKHTHTYTRTHTPLNRNRGTRKDSNKFLQLRNIFLSLGASYRVFIS